MLKKRIIPVLLLKNGRLVKTIQFDKYRDVGNPVATAKIYNAQRADELIILDIEASAENRGALCGIIKEMAEECLMPLGVGGGVRSLDDIRLLLLNGADKIVVNTAAVEQAGFVRQAAEKFGSSTIVLSIDYRTDSTGQPRVFIRGGKQPTVLDPVDFAKKMVAEGAGEIVITSIDRDGVMQGLDIPFIKKMVSAVNVPVICCGGVGSLSDF